MTMNYRDAAAYMSALSMLLGALQQFLTQGQQVQDAKIKLGRGPLMTQDEYQTVLNIRDNIVTELKTVTQEGGKSVLTDSDLRLPYSDVLAPPEKSDEPDKPDEPSQPDDPGGEA
jgi:hypothetical protein